MSRWLPVAQLAGALKQRPQHNARLAGTKRQRPKPPPASDPTGGHLIRLAQLHDDIILQDWRLLSANTGVEDERLWQGHEWIGRFIDAAQEAVSAGIAAPRCEEDIRRATIARKAAETGWLNTNDAMTGILRLDSALNAIHTCLQATGVEHMGDKFFRWVDTYFDSV